MVERIESGVRGLDEAIEGGFPSPSVILVTGEAGCGKTTFVMQSLFHGAAKKEKGVYISGMSEPVFMIKKFMSTFAFYDEKLIENKIIQFWDFGSILSSEFAERSLAELDRIIAKEKPQRVVIDPLPMGYTFPSALAYRKYLFNIFNTLKKMDIFTLVVGERHLKEVSEVVNYMADGIINLSFQPIDNPLKYKNLIHVRKMRGTNHAKDIMSMEISRNGITVFKIE